MPWKANPIKIAINIPIIVADAPIIAEAIPAIAPIGSIAKALRLPIYKPFKKKASIDQMMKINRNSWSENIDVFRISRTQRAKIICKAKPTVARKIIPSFITNIAFIKLAGAARIEMIAK